MQKVKRCISKNLFTVMIFSLLLNGCSGESKNNIEQSAEVASIGNEDVLKTDPSAAVNPNDNRNGGGIAAIANAAGDGCYLYIFFYKDDSEFTKAMRVVFDEATVEVSERAYSLAIDVNDPNEVDFIAKYGAASAPMPLALIIAPNGAVTGGFPGKFSVKQLVGGIVSPCTEKCLKALQDRKLVFLCVQNSETKSNTSAMQGVNDFKSDPKFAQGTEIVSLDPMDTSEAKFLESLQIDPKTNIAITAFLAPPGSVVAKFNGPTDKDRLVAAITSASSGGCGPAGASSCGPSGCP